MNKVRIATRQSPLALWQAHHVAGLLSARHPGLEVSLVELTTEGDRFLSAPLSRVGGKGLFVKEIEQAVLDGRADLAVHSLKDMTSVLGEGLCLAAVPSREDPRDAFVGFTGKKLFSLPEKALVGTSSLRRTCQVLGRRPDLRMVTLRGNVQTRLRKAGEKGLAGTLLARAGLKRLNLEDRISEVLEPEECLPAVGQGALAIECREDDGELRGLLAPLEDPQTRIAITAERAFLQELEGGCTVPLAGYAVLEAGEIWIRGLVGSPDGTRIVRGEMRGPLRDAQALGKRLALDLLSRGGEEILRAFASGAPQGS